MPQRADLIDEGRRTDLLFEYAMMHDERTSLAREEGNVMGNGGHRMKFTLAVALSALLLPCLAENRWNGEEVCDFTLSTNDCLCVGFDWVKSRLEQVSGFKVVGTPPWPAQFRFETQLSRHRRFTVADEVRVLVETLHANGVALHRADGELRIFPAKPEEVLAKRPRDAKCEDELALRSGGRAVDISFEKAPISLAVRALADLTDSFVILGITVQGTITLEKRGCGVKDFLDMLAGNGLAVEKVDGRIFALRQMGTNSVASAFRRQGALPPNRLVAGVEFGERQKCGLHSTLRTGPLESVFRSCVVETTPKSHRVCLVRYFGSERQGENAEEELRGDVDRAIRILKDSYGITMKQESRLCWKGRALQDGPAEEARATLRMDVARNCAVRLEIESLEWRKVAKAEGEIGPARTGADSGFARRRSRSDSFRDSRDVTLSATAREVLRRFDEWQREHPYHGNDHKIALEKLCGHGFGEHCTGLSSNLLICGGSRTNLQVSFPPFRKMGFGFGAQPGHPLRCADFGYADPVSPDELTVKGDYKHEAELLRKRFESLFGIVMQKRPSGGGYSYSDEFNSISIGLDVHSHQGDRVKVHPLVVSVADLELERQNDYIRRAFEDIKKRAWRDAELASLPPDRRIEMPGVSCPVYETYNAESVSGLFVERCYFREWSADSIAGVLASLTNIPNAKFLDWEFGSTDYVTKDGYGPTKVRGGAGGQGKSYSYVTSRRKGDFFRVFDGVQYRSSLVTGRLYEMNFDKSYGDGEIATNGLRDACLVLDRVRGQFGDSVKLYVLAEKALEKMNERVSNCRESYHCGCRVMLSDRFEISLMVAAQIYDHGGHHNFLSVRIRDVDLYKLAQAEGFEQKKRKERSAAPVAPCVEGTTASDHPSSREY